MADLGITNTLLAGTRGQPIPEVGMGVTFLSWTDRNPGTIHAIRDDKKWLWIEVSDDELRRTDNNGFSERQEYEYTPMPNRRHQTWRRPATNPDAPFILVYQNPMTGRWVISKGSRIRIGRREKYEDPHF